MRPLTERNTRRQVREGDDEDGNENEEREDLGGRGRRNSPIGSRGERKMHERGRRQPKISSHGYDILRPNEHNALREGLEHKDGKEGSRTESEVMRKNPPTNDRGELENGRVQGDINKERRQDGADTVHADHGHQDNGSRQGNARRWGFTVRVVERVVVVVFHIQRVCPLCSILPKDLAQTKVINVQVALKTKMPRPVCAVMCKATNTQTKESSPSGMKFLSLKMASAFSTLEGLTAAVTATSSTNSSLHEPSQNVHDLAALLMAWIISVDCEYLFVFRGDNNVRKQHWVDRCPDSTNPSMRQKSL